MKYAEFVKKMNSLGFSVETGNTKTLICKRIDTDTIVMSISKVFENAMTIDMFTSEPNETMAIKWATKLARTPLNDRITPSGYEIILPHLSGVGVGHLCIIKIGEKYYIGTTASNYDRRIFSESDMLAVPKEYHAFARNIETGEPYISEGVSL